MYLEKINSPEDVKNLSINEMNELSSEIRQVLLKKLSEHGGHIGPNLGIVELTIALHHVFNSPQDKIVYDVSRNITAIGFSRFEVLANLKKLLFIYN